MDNGISMSNEIDNNSQLVSIGRRSAAGILLSLVRGRGRIAGGILAVGGTGSLPGGIVGGAIGFIGVIGIGRGAAR